MRLSLEESPASSYEDCVTCKNDSPCISDSLVMTTVVNGMRACVILNFTQIQNVTFSVARGMKTSDLNSIKLEHLLILNWNGASRDIVERSAYYLLSCLCKIKVTARVIMVLVGGKNMREVFTLLLHVVR